jgi:glucose-1-phosphate cytidylyltransferase
MKVVILAGGFGSRISEYTEAIPKPMIKIGDKPILYHIMNYYASYGHNEFIIALGYKSEIIKDYFLNYKVLNSDFTINMSSEQITVHNKSSIDWKITLVDTGSNAMTGGRLIKLKKFIGKQDFMLTYGDGLSNVDLKKLLKFHKNHNKMVTVTAVRPSARFGELKIVNDKVERFEEKPQISDGWINGGFFVMKSIFIDLIKDEKTILERAPLEKVAIMNELNAYKHNDFWHCMDTKRDKDRLEEIYYSGKVPWIIND